MTNEKEKEKVRFRLWRKRRKQREEGRELCVTKKKSIVVILSFILLLSRLEEKSYSSTFLPKLKNLHRTWMSTLNSCISASIVQRQKLHLLSKCLISYKPKCWKKVDRSFEMEVMFLTFMSCLRISTTSLSSKYFHAYPKLQTNNIFIMLLTEEKYMCISSKWF